MTYIAHDARLVAEALNVAPAVTAKKTSLWRTFMEALKESRRIEAEREIGRYIALHGGVLTDAIDREIGMKFGQPR